MSAESRGELVRFFRGERSQRELAERIGRSVDLVGRMERGRRAVTDATAERIAVALDLGPDDHDRLMAAPASPADVDIAVEAGTEIVLVAEVKQLQRRLDELERRLERDLAYLTGRLDQVRNNPNGFHVTNVGR